MEDIIIHRGGELVTKEQLDLIRIPETTDSYVPVSHYHLADKLLTVSRDLLTDFALVGENYAVARQGQQLFALLKFKRDNSEIGLSVAFRNSYDRSMSVGLAIGASVFICDNLALHGEIAVMKKHIKGVWNAFEDLAITTLYKAQHNWEKVITDAEGLKGTPIDNHDAFQLMGLLYGHDIVSPRQLPVIREEWLRPRHEEFNARNKWSFFNAVTEALKSTPPVSIMEKHVRAYQEIVEDG
jgi:hypothetical protein